MQIFGVQIHGMKYQNPNKYFQFQHFEAPNMESNIMGDDGQMRTMDHMGAKKVRKGLMHNEN